MTHATRTHEQSIEGRKDASARRRIFRRYIAAYLTFTCTGPLPLAGLGVRCCGPVP
jgi:hypothetical protein